MVADDDKNGEEYNPEVTGVEHPEKISEDEYTPMHEEEPVVATAAQEGSSPAKKLMVAIVLIVAVFAVASYLTHQKKARVAAQAETTPVVSNKPLVTQDKVLSPKPEKSLSENKNAPVFAAKPDQIKKVDLTENKPVIKPEIKPPVPVPTAAPEVVAENKAVLPVSNKQLEDSAAKMAMSAEVPATTSGSAAEKSAAPVAPQVPSDIDKQVSALKDQAKTNENKLNDINSHVTNLDTAISKLNNSISALDRKIGDMTVVPKANNVQVSNEVTAMHQQRFMHPGNFGQHHKHRMQMGERNKMMNANLNNSVNTSQGPSNKVGYVVRAIVPGRAWVESPTGYKFSISIGDRVLGYGTVTKVDADNGEVTFDGGDVIKYGSDDH